MHVWCENLDDLHLQSVPSDWCGCEGQLTCSRLVMKMLPLRGEYMLGETQTLHISSFRCGQAFNQHDTCGVSCAVRVIYSSVCSIF